jgi:REP element-mobilizing transposase RayT
MSDALSGVGPLRVTHSRALPHWYRAEGIYFITFRLAGSLPLAVSRRLLQERQIYLRSLATTDAGEIRRTADRWWFAHLENYLHRGPGLFTDQRLADTVRDVLLFGDGKRHDLVAWCIMPNHVHAVVRLRSGYQVSGIVKNWKGISSRNVNRLRDTEGTVWQKEYFERLIRDHDELWRTGSYTLRNPRKAGLKNWRWRGVGRPDVLRELDCRSLAGEL